MTGMNNDEQMIRYLRNGNLLFGSYPQGPDGEVEPIEWKVLEKQNGRLLVISEKGLDAEPYNYIGQQDNTWENCDLREWLNDDFFYSAFTAQERRMIAWVTVTDDRNPNHDTLPGNDTEDRVFVLSMNEADRFFQDDLARRCKPTDHAKAAGAFTDPDNGNCWWWLRTPGDKAQYVSAVGDGGSYYTNMGGYADDTAVRPALWIEDPTETTALRNDNKALRLENENLFEQMEQMTAEAGAPGAHLSSPEKTVSLSANPVQYLSSGNIRFGRYPQGAYGEVKPIEWRVLDEAGGRMLVVSEYALDMKKYHYTFTGTDWENCSLRTWLGDEFFNRAFNAVEQQMIPAVTLTTDKKRGLFKARIDTRDRVFPLSMNEARQYFKDDPARRCRPTDYAKAQGSDFSSVNGNCCWWLRSFGMSARHAVRIRESGVIDEEGINVDNNSICSVRPALWIDLSTERKFLQEENKTLWQKNEDLAAKLIQMKEEIEALKASATPVPSTVSESPVSSRKDDLVQYLPNGNILFGRYTSDLNDEVKPVEWRVLEKKDGKMLVISEQGLDAQLYNDSGNAGTWENCSLRCWLNGEFFNRAFNEEEQRMISLAAVPADSNPEYDTPAGNDTQDHVFLLSVNEADQYFHDKIARECRPTLYAEFQGALSDAYQGNCWWWLRSPGMNPSLAAVVAGDGEIGTRGYGGRRSYGAVRPALWMELPQEMVLQEENDTLRQKNEALAAKMEQMKKEIEALKASHTSSSSAALSSSLPSASSGSPAPSKKRDLIQYLPNGNILFGHYPQKANNEVRPIEWKVLEKRDGKMLVISQYALEQKIYHYTRGEAVTWKDCTLRSWLNREFFDRAFNDAEQRMIPLAPVLADKNPKYDTPVGKETQDHVFLLSINEANRYFKDFTARECKPTAYVKAQGIQTSGFFGSGCCDWWLRTPGNKPDEVAYVNDFGHVDDKGFYPDYNDIAVRPALWIDPEA